MGKFGVEGLDWPAQSSDLNLIKHFWDKMDASQASSNIRI